MTENKETQLLTAGEPVKEVTAPGQPLTVPKSEVDAVAPKVPEKKEESPVAIGYRVGVRESGEFVFEVLGTKPGLVELLGVHQYAARKVGLLYDRAQLEGQAATAAGLNQLNSKLNQTIETLREVLNSLVLSQPKKE